MSDEPQKRRFSASPSPPREARRIPASNSIDGRRFSPVAQPVRVARRIMSKEYLVGSIISIPAPVGELELQVIAPDGLKLFVPVVDGVVPLWLPQVGVWNYQWSDDINQQINVLPDPNQDHVQKHPEVKIDPRSLPAMSVIRKPKF